MRNIAGDMLHREMQRVFNEHTQFEQYRSIPQAQLLIMLRKNLVEAEYALQNNELVLDKLADLGNYVAFLMRNHVDGIQHVG